jgi:hypothetical protein
MVWCKIRGSSQSKDGGWLPVIDTHGREFYGKPRLIMGCRATHEDER